MTKKKNDKSQISTCTAIRKVRIFDGEKLIKTDTVLLHDGVITDIGNNIWLY